MLSQWFTTAKPPAPSGHGTHYVFKPSLAGGARQFELTDEGLRWGPTLSEFWPWQRIATVPKALHWRISASARSTIGAAAATAAFSTASRSRRLFTG